MPSNNKFNKKTPDELIADAKMLLKIARERAKENQQRQLLRIGIIFHREIINGWSTPPQLLSTELETILCVKVEFPVWICEQKKEGKSA